MRGWLLLLMGCGRIGFDPADSVVAANVVSAGGQHSCAIASGELFCWGDNASGQLGLGDTAPRLTPTAAGIDARWTHITAGEAHTCGARTDGEVFCWGGNASGQLGIGDIATRPDPALTITVGIVEDLHARNDHTCLLHDGGMLSCWGANFEGQLGLGDPADSPDKLSPISVPTSSAVSAMSTGSGHTLAVSNGTLFGTGRNTSDQLGLGDLAPGQLRVLTQIDDLGTWTAIAGGQNLSCGIRDGSLACWGQNANEGHLGTGDNTSHSTPVLIETTRTWATLDANTFGGCAIARTSLLLCWGRGAEGQLGLGDNTDRLSPTPTGFDDWIAISTGRFHNCGMRADQSVWCSGANDNGQIGNGNTERQFEWTQVLP